MAGVAGKGGPRGDISAEKLFAAAEKLIARHGPGALTQRRIAQQAGVSPNALYTYVADLEEIRIELGDRFSGAIDTELLLIGDPSAALIQFLRHVQKLFTDSPEHAQLLAQQRIAGPTLYTSTRTCWRFSMTGSVTQPQPRPVSPRC
ncbi:TetR/AcrR family transcriptional regulator [Corynebacterium liangguodongii]|nr:TetR/AcrR family transcriptional regulator [Corynebacterium liangguodongii]